MFKKCLICFDVRICSIQHLIHILLFSKKMHHDLVVDYPISGNKHPKILRNICVCACDCMYKVLY